MVLIVPTLDPTYCNYLSCISFSLLGDHCERCITGYYGNATLGSPHACQTCSCYGGHNSCDLSIDGSSFVCNCRDGYDGDRCQSCVDGYFGIPTEVWSTKRQTITRCWLHSGQYMWLSSLSLGFNSCNVQLPADNFTCEKSVFSLTYRQISQFFYYYSGFLL